MAGVRQISLIGFSGRRLELIPPDTVRKYRGTADRTRWKADIQKHLKLIELAKTTHLFKVPELIEVVGFNGGYLDRRYVPGVTLERHLEDTRGNDAIEWADWLDQTLSVLGLTGECGEEEAARAYLDRLWTDRISTITPHSASDRHWLDRYHQNLAFIRSGPKPKISFSRCHGDLAFDNILIDEDGEPWLIDPLASPLESCFWDAAKVLQSAYCNWRDIRRGVFRPAPAYMGAFTYVIFCSERRREALYYLCCVLLRIIPYAQHHQQKMALLKWIVTVQEQR